MRLLGVALKLLPILGVKFPQKNHFGGVNKRFQAKHAKYSNFNIIKLLQQFQSHFAQW